ncbi:MAG: hypothetical protein GQF41_0587 [Candidatus Rifleibacterium amylolyticum]|nr:MAG: hypothetical protein GQF41_0587 [Candidatus Rifleibacterium amylolyticum]
MNIGRQAVFYEPPGKILSGFTMFMQTLTHKTRCHQVWQ